ncbi:hypothetical protein PIB30_055552 [Stylosanthes scabra]|uniref:RNase H type-1 domain-containing protein n=1 Tax=Stylosanthes scabra TaxID=79078 RepID=A0ABU6WL38_9FABA|nr:hypothetical protein [Stylosanthes scabra]
MALPHLAGFSCILRNSDGIFLKACSGRIQPAKIFRDLKCGGERDLAKKIMELLIRDLVVQFEHIARDANKAADWLAKWRADYTERMEVGDDLQALLLQDFS